MAEFAVDADAVGKYGVLVGRQGATAARYRSMLDDGALTTNMGERGILGIIVPVSATLLQDARENTARAATLGEGAAAELVKAADYYDEADKSAEAWLAIAVRDGEFVPPLSPPQVGPQHVPPHLQEKDFDDPANPDLDRSGRPFDAGGLANADDEKMAEDLTAGTGWPTGLEQNIDELLQLGGRLGAINDWITSWLGIDLWETALETFGGDWQSFHRQAVLFDQVGFAFQGVKTNIDHGRTGIAPLWNGNAAERADVWFLKYSESCAAHTQYLTEASDLFCQLARSTYHFVQGIKQHYAAMVDLAIELASLLTGGTLNRVIDIAIGFIDGTIQMIDIDKIIRGFGDGVDIQDFRRIVALFAQAQDIVSKVMIAVSNNVAQAHLVQSLLSTLAMNGPIHRQLWPPEPYDHPAV